MTPIEIMAVIVAVIVGLKLIVMLIKPESWMVVVNKIYKVPAITTAVMLVLAAFVLNYLLAELTIVHIFAVMLFFMLLAGAGVSVYSKEVVGMAKKMLKKEDIVKKSWLLIVIWLVLIIWLLYVLFI